MTFNTEKLLTYPIPVARQRVTPTACMLYAVSLGLPYEPMDGAELSYVYEENLRVLPMMGNILAHPGFWPSGEGTGIDWRRMLHAEQALEIHGPLPSEGQLVGRTRIVDIVDRGEGKGAFIYTEREVTDEVSGKRVCTIRQTNYCGGDGGCGSTTTVRPRAHALPDRSPDLSMVLPISPRAAILYRLNGDLNPIHIDPRTAAEAGFDRPILHGLCTFGLAGYAVLKTVCSLDGAAIRAMATRFSAPLFPAETLVTEIWRDGPVISFRARARERDVVVLDHGRIDLRS